MHQTKWFERKFDFNIAEDIFPSILERLEGTPVRLKEKCKKIPLNFLSVRLNNTWSIKENIGHLSDLETWQQRIEDIVNENPELQAADLQNKKTDLAIHNNTPVKELLLTFRKLRLQTIAIIENLNDAAFLKSSFHPRLKKPMRIVDLFLFVAEHDDHHLARISELVRILKSDF